MNTSEKIAEVVTQFLAADREEDRKRIAELERDNAMLTIQSNAMHEKCAALVVENKRLSEYASGNWVDVPPPSDAGCLYPECGPTCRRDCPPAPAVEMPAVKRGAWVVVYDNGVDPADYWTGLQWSFDIGKAKQWTEKPSWKRAGRAVFMSELEVIE